MVRNPLSSPTLPRHVPERSSARKRRAAGLPQSRRTAFKWWAFLLVLLLCGMASAATTLRHRASHLTRKSPEEVLRILTAYEQHCDRGCRYWGPRVAKWVTVPYKRTRDDHYTWTYMSARRDAEYFAHVRVTRRDDGSIQLKTRMLDDRDEDLVELLEDQTGRDHDPGFDDGEVIIEIRPLGDGNTRVTESITLTASGLLSLYAGTIRAGIEECVRASFRNIDL